MRILNLIIEQDAAADAKKKGLKNVGFGRWADKKNKVVAKTVDGKLVPVKPNEEKPKGREQPNQKPINGKTPTEKKPSAEKPQQTKPKEPPTKIKPSEFPDSPAQQASTKLKDLLPKTTINMSSNYPSISKNDKLQVSTLLDKLKQMADDAKAKGSKAPNYDLCQVSIPGTNLFCGGNKGIPRIEMPQFKGTPAPGSVADKLPKDDKGEADADALFKKLLQNKGIKTVQTQVPADRLKSTQSQLVGAKVAGMAAALDKNPEHPGITAPIYVSRDGYVLDGHHRWAAVVGHSMKTNRPTPMNVNIIDMDIDELLPMANAYAKEIGIVQKGG